MVCIVVGLFLTSVTRQILIGFNVHDHLRPAPLVYVCMMILFTLSAWLALYQN